MAATGVSLLVMNQCAEIVLLAPLEQKLLLCATITSATNSFKYIAYNPKMTTFTAFY